MDMIWDSMADGYGMAYWHGMAHLDRPRFKRQISYRIKNNTDESNKTCNLQESMKARAAGRCGAL